MTTQMRRHLTPSSFNAPTGMAHIVAAIKAHCPQLAAVAATPQLSNGSSSTILPMKSEEDLAFWEKLDDVIMVSHRA